MSYQFVAVPVLKGRSTFVVDKGRNWSSIEHLLLEALARRPWTSRSLAEAGSLPRLVVVEAITRLMRAGWVELAHSESQILFSATARGRTVCSLAELPSVVERGSKTISYIIDLIGGGVFRKRSLILHKDHELISLYGNRCVRIEPTSIEATLDPNEIISALLDDDETFIATERSGTSRLNLLTSVRDGVIDGLPDNKELRYLREAIHEASRTQIATSATQEPTIHSLPKNWRQQFDLQPAQEHPIKFSSSDLILDGPAHRNELINLLDTARTVAIIHSTFIRAEAFFDIFDNIRNAINRGVRVHVMWGQNEDEDERASTQLAIKQILSTTEVRSLGDNLVIHPFSTGSHAKILIADSVSHKGYTAVIGSCNWLSSGFASYEVSIRLQDPNIVEEVVRKLSALVPVRNGDWTKFSSELVHLRMSVASAPRRGQSNASASIVIGAMHNDEILRARDNSTSKIFVVSHRLGAVASPSVLVPLKAAIRNKGIDATVFYGRSQKPVTRSTEREMNDEASEKGIDINCIKRPRIHAKFVAWDEDDAVITSLNWLSADPSGLDNLNEIGVRIHAAGVATALTASFNEAINENQKLGVGT